MTLAGCDLQEGAALLRRERIETLAVFRALQVGDMLCAVPALRALRAALPAARITLVGLPWAEQFARRFDRYIDDFVAFPGHPSFPEQAVREELVPGFYDALRARRIDLALQMHGNGQISNRVVADFGARTMAGFAMNGGTDQDSPGFLAYPEQGPEPLRLLSLVEFLGAPAAGTHLEFPLTPDDERELDASGFADGLEAGRYICIHPGARIRDKCWSPQRFAEIADRLADEYGLTVVLTGSAKEADLTAAVASHMRNEAVDTASPLSLGAMAALMSRARLLICNDTGVSHIAAGLQLPSVVIFSKADMQRWAPLDQDLHRCIWDPAGQHAAEVLEHARELIER
ncbi:MAG TPA: glycosyltransferase family 9 protein [Noviherbaspirillum sp.]|uniref:glycosyltransferase family 9 protein n=1 Tax=Noviherbaspirillum sp. TaxID=1926288 RepID=UPI002D434956|nr:glycosyltransferase family 9 protein [Noviherbaspirillum sp.]HYD97119.1 glycosyltransferase family 9 protein [Noviherbaspirillum sp.]